MMQSKAPPSNVIQRPTFSWVEESVAGTNDTYRMLRACCAPPLLSFPLTLSVRIVDPKCNEVGLRC